MDTRGEPDEILTQSLRELDQAAWTTLFNEHQVKIWRYVFARTGSRELADDTTAQVFVEALESIHRFRYRGKPILVWLYGIAKNQLGKRVRSQKREAASLHTEPSADPISTSLDSIILREALASLTPDQADVVVLRFYSGYSTREIAAAMGKSESAVYSLEIRAIASLRRYLENRRRIS